MSTVDRFIEHQRLFTVLLVVVLVWINATILATSILMEAHRAGAQIPWSQPFITEYTSGLAWLLLVPAIIRMVDLFPLRWGLMRRNLLYHIGLSVLFCVAHIALFVLMRRILFGLQGTSYNFSDDYLLSFIYEYRKDAWTYAIIILVTYGYRMAVSRLRGEAIPVAAGEDDSRNSPPERLLVRKLGKEFVIRVEDVEWLEAAGNYVNLHVGQRVYPLRATMTKLVDKLESRGFARIHRSRGVNLDYVESITPLESGDCTVSLRSGQTLNLSRRYRELLRQQLDARAS